MGRLSKYLRLRKVDGQNSQSNRHASAAQRDQSGSTKSITVTGNSPMRMATFADDMIIGKAIRDSGHFQEDSISTVANFLKTDHALKPLFIDIGANIGTHSIYALGNGFSKAVCIEPDPDNFMLLRINQILNGLDSRCININAAVSAEDGELEFELSPDNFGDHRLRLTESDVTGTHGENQRRVISVQARRLDKLVDDHRIDLTQAGLIWVDTQGHEGHVLSSAKAVEETGIPVVLEFWPYGLERNDGYKLLRQFLARQERIFDVRNISENAQPLTIDVIDKLYEEWLTLEKPGYSPHTDLLVIN